MARMKVGSRGSGKTIIRVFCEGESEQAYTEFLKQKFSDVAVINYPKETGIFDRAKDYPVAVKNAKKTMKRLLDEGMPGLDDTDDRNQWLYRNCLTFSNVYEAIEFLEGLEGKASCFR